MTNTHADIKLKVIAKAPYIIPIINQMKRRDKDFFGDIPEEVPGVSDSNGNYWIDIDNPNLNTDDLATILMHEACHILQRHVNRAIVEGLDNLELANIAGDLTINDAIKDTFNRIEGGVYINTINEHPVLKPATPIKLGMSFEHIYELLNKAGGNQNLETIKELGNCKHTQGDDQDISETDKANMDAAIQQSISDLSKSSNAPDSLREAAKLQLQQSKVNWRVIIRKAIKSNLDSITGKPKRSYRRTNRRQQIKDPLLMPGTVHSKTKVLIGLDTSGSMGSISDTHSPLSIAINEVFTATRTADVKGFSVTTSAQEITPIKTISDLHKLLDRTGGTDMSVAFDTAKLNNQKLILITDGDTPWPNKDEAKEIPHLVIVVDTYDTNPDIPSYINHITVK